MIGDNFNDGDIISLVDVKNLQEDGFIIDENRDLTTILSSEIDSTYNKKNRLNFVGFTINEQGAIKTVFPKNYKWGANIEIDRRKIFKSIIKHMYKKPDMYIGPEFKKNISTNYPFSAFYSIYEYYLKYGIHFEQQKRIKPYGSGKVNWKQTIRLSQKYIVDGKLLVLPIYHNETRRTDTFLANCMIFAIDYTIDKFSSFIENEKTNRPFPEFDFQNHSEFVVKSLHYIRNNHYNDIIIKLIDNLIKYFSVFKSSGKFYLKHYSYSSIWEDMVMIYLRNHYKDFEDNKMVLSDTPIPVKKKFEKPTFHPNASDKTKYFQPDYYLIESDTQIILDAKYYDPTDMDYKQISYLLFLKNKRETITDQPLFSETYSALIIPSFERNSKVHFEMDPLFNKECADFIISEERLNIKAVIEFWIKN